MRNIHVIRPIIAYPDAELLFPLASRAGHNAINIAVANGLLQTIGSRIIQHDILNGVNSYIFLYNEDICAQFLVAPISEFISSVQFNIIGTVDSSSATKEEDLFTPKVAHLLTCILQAVCQCIEGHLRRQYVIDELKPPPPPFEEIKALVMYQRIYFPNLNDEEFSHRINVPIQTLRNWRNKIGMSQYMFRPGVVDWDEILSVKDPSPKSKKKTRKSQ